MQKNDRPLRVLGETEEWLEIELHNDEMVPPQTDSVLLVGFIVVLIIVAAIVVWNLIHG